MMIHYNSYRDSGIEWIGEIPSHWILSRIGRHFFMERGRVISKEEISDNLGEYPVYSSQTENYGVLGSINTFDFEGEYVTWTTDGANAGTCFYRTGKFNTTNVCGLLSYRVSGRNDLKFLNYLLNLGTKGYVRVDINPKLMNNMMGDIPFISPPLSEQEHIVSYLDDKTTKIDELIQNKLRKIDFLKEYRTSLINTVVTKGLNPDVPMKESGIEWIGEIPSHWEVKRMKYVTHSLSGYSFKSDDFDINKEVPVIRIGDVSDSIDFESCIKIDSYFLDIKKEFIIYKDDILIGLTGGTIGKSGRYNYSFPSLLNQRVGLVRNTDSLNNSLLYYLVKSNYFSEYIDFNCYGGGQDNISMNDIGDMSLPLPPLSEQEQIVTYLDEKTSQIDKTIDIEKKKIELLKEYRQSLISNVVTGKIKVVY
jgi:type I restriction enzyme S subunit